MKRIYYVLPVILLALISLKCQKELSIDHSTQSNSPLPVTATLQGNVLDENGLPASGVKITVGSKTTVTDSHGYFRIAGAQLDKNSSLAVAEQPGYFKAYRSFRATTGVNQLVIQLTKKVLAGTLTTTAGGAVALTGGARVSLPANGVTKAAGGAYTGDVRVYAAYIDPTAKEIGKTVPGSFMATDKNDNRVALSSYAMLAVELESPAGEKLQVQPGNVATLTMPIPAPLVSSAPSSISLWYINEASGTWAEQGTAKKSGNNYIGEVKHFSYWNCDIAAPGTGFSAVFKSSDGVPLKNLYVTIRMAENKYGGCAHGYTDSLGQVAGLVPANENLILEVNDDCYNVVYSKNIGVLTTGADLGTFVIPNTLPSLVTVKGKLVSCDNKPVAGGYAIIYWNNFVSYVPADVMGSFSTTFLTCQVASQTCEILGVDTAASQQGAVLTIPVTSQLTDAGNVDACGISTVLYMNYTLDGNTVKLSGMDSLIAFNYIGAGATTVTYLEGLHYPDQLLDVSFSGNAEPGSYPLNTLTAAGYTRTKLTRPFNITLTAFPQHSGEFYEGSFTGSFIDSSAVSVTHAISCTFRIRKY